MGIFFNQGARRRDRYRSHLQQMLREKRGTREITPEDFAKGMQASKRNSVIEHCIAKSQQSGSEDSTLKGDFDWVGIWEWMKENWWEILKIVITIAIMFAETSNEKEFYGEGLSADSGPGKGDGGNPFLHGVDFDTQ